MKKSDEKTIDFRDFLAEILRSWKTVLIIVLIFAVLAAGFAGYRSKKSKKQANSGAGKNTAAKEIDLKAEEKALKEQMRGMITDAEAEEVERVYTQYRSYIDYRNMLQDELQNYDKVYDKSGEEMVIKRVNYRLLTDVEGAENQFTAYALDIDDFKKIAEVLPDVQTISAAYKHVYFGSAAGTTVTLTNSGDPSLINQADYMITVEMLGNTKEICDEIWKIIQGAFQKKVAELKKVDPDVSLELIGSNYRGNIYEYYIGRKQSIFDTIQKVDTIISSIRTQSIDKFTEDQAAYYQALANPQRGLINKGLISINGLNTNTAAGQTAPSFLNGKTMIVLGVLAGLFLSILFMLIRYLSSGTIKINREIQDYYQLPILSTFFVSGKKKGIFHGLVRWLLHADSIGPEIKADMIAADTCGVVRQDGGEAIYIVRLGDDAEDEQIASSIKNSVESSEPAIDVITGTPLTDVGELHRLAQGKNVLLLIHNKKTLKADVEKLLDFCRRHSIRVLGAANIIDID